MFVRKAVALILLTVGFIVASGSGVYAQLMATVVTACGTPPQTLHAGSPAPLLMDTSGNFCTGGGGSGGSTNATIVAPVTSLGAVEVDTSDAGTGNLIAAINAPIAGQASGANVPLGGIGLCDGANSASPCTTAATVLAASTASAPTNKALVVSPINQDPCSYAVKTSYALSSNATSLTQLIAASGTKVVYICSIAVITASATAFNLNTGTGTNCGSSTAALIGSTTAANGMSLAANGGFTLGNGGFSVAVTPASSEVCILQSNASYSSGVITYVQQ